jgi:hypothetical protein
MNKTKVRRIIVTNGKPDEEQAADMQDPTQAAETIAEWDAIRGVQRVTWRQGLTSIAHHAYEQFERSSKEMGTLYPAVRFFGAFKISFPEWLQQALFEVIMTGQLKYLAAPKGEEHWYEEWLVSKLGREKWRREGKLTPNFYKELRAEVRARSGLDVKNIKERYFAGQRYQDEAMEAFAEAEQIPNDDDAQRLLALGYFGRPEIKERRRGRRHGRNSGKQPKKRNK